MAKLFARISLIPPGILWPAVFVLSIIGAYGPNQSMGDVYVMLAAGVVSVGALARAPLDSGGAPGGLERGAVPAFGAGASGLARARDGLAMGARPLGRGAGHALRSGARPLE